jgi:hypothetical protein
MVLAQVAEHILDVHPDISLAALPPVHVNVEL